MRIAYLSDSTITSDDTLQRGVRCQPSNPHGPDSGKNKGKWKSEERLAAWVVTPREGSTDLERLDARSSHDVLERSRMSLEAAGTSSFCTTIPRPAGRMIPDVSERNNRPTKVEAGYDRKFSLSMLAAACRPDCAESRAEDMRACEGGGKPRLFFLDDCG